MNERIKRISAEILEKFNKDKKAVLIIILGVAGMLMIALSEFTPEEKSSDVHTEYSAQDRDITEEVENIIGEISGVGRVSVMITYECSKESIYAKDISEHRDEKEMKTDSEYILVGSGSEESGLILKEVYPKVCGVAVVCDGGGIPSVKNEVTAVLKALFDISSNNISIVQMQN